MLTYFRILAYGRSYFRFGILAVAALLVSTLFSAVSLVSVIPFLEILFTTGPVTAPEAPLVWYDTASLKAHGFYYLSQAMATYGPQRLLLYFCLFLLVAILIKNAARYLSAFWIAPLEHGIVKSLRDTLFAHLSELGLAYFTRRKKGDLIGVLISDVQVVQEAVIGTFFALLREPITMLAFFLALLFISWQLTLFILIILPLTGWVISRISRSLKKRTRRGQEALGRLIGRLDEFITGIRIVKAFQKEAYENARYQAENQRYTDLQVAVRRRVELASPVTEVLSLLVICLIIYYGGGLILGQEATLKASEFIGFIAVFSQFLAPIKVISNAVTKIQKGLAAYERITQVLESVSDVPEAAAPRRVAALETEIRFEGVYFRYGEEDVLQDISFSLRKGETVALVGPSGGGKSTLADLLPRFYDPYRGQILLDGTDLRDLALADVRRLIGIVSQEGLLFHDTVLQNIAYGDPQPDRAAVMEAARIANAHEFIMALPQQYDTLIGERGTMLSGGQRQRIAIARAILRNPPILILDEATSNLDTQSEKLVQEALDHLMQARTSLIIAHRLSTIVHADRILVIEAGRIREQGRHEALMAAGGLYRELYQLQFRG